MLSELRKEQMIFGEKYRFISAITGESGPGLVWIENEAGRVVFKYLSEEGELSYCHPGPLTKFVKEKEV